MKISKIRDVKTPARGTEKSAGIDFFVPNDFETTQVLPNQSIRILSGIKANVPSGYALIAFNKSGIALKGLQVGACVVGDTYIRTNKGLFKANVLTKEFVTKNDIKILSYNRDTHIYSYEVCDGFRISNITDCIKLTFDNSDEMIISRDQIGRAHV